MSAEIGRHYLHNRQCVVNACVANWRVMSNHQQQEYVYVRFGDIQVFVVLVREGAKRSYRCERTHITQDNIC